MAINSIRKGNQFERDAAKLLGKAICDDPRGFVRMGLQGRSIEKFRGDLIPNLNPSLPERVKALSAAFARLWMVDAKDRKKWTIDGLVLSPKSEPWAWWDKLVDASEEVGMSPLMILKYRGKVWGVVQGAADCWTKAPRGFYLKAHGYDVLIFPWDEMSHFNTAGLEVLNAQPREKGVGVSA